ncbi:hypothetical protein POM88_054239 [Heracleum sosnowskyi]|uniref:Uncharacterized protein n=1 Tax=Heracleum sosnowskyi TaxID=360622 RepID=A0AAD8GNF7_9APIA|nr:hypothetical protein POM88_054239 [Heracleum sosnowskyi]
MTVHVVPTHSMQQGRLPAALVHHQFICLIANIHPNPAAEQASPASPRLSRQPHTTHASHTTHAALPPSFCIAYLKLPPSSVSSELETLTYSAPPPSTAASPPPGDGTTKPRSDTKCWNY